MWLFSSIISGSLIKTGYSVDVVPLIFGLPETMRETYRSHPDESEPGGANWIAFEINYTDYRDTDREGHQFNQLSWSRR